MMFNRQQTRQCIEANIMRPGGMSREEQVSNIMLHVETLVTTLDKQTRKEIAVEINSYREQLRFIWRWIDRLHGGKPHDRPEQNWKEYVAVLINYPSSPHNTKDWYEDDDSSPLLRSLR